MLDRLDLLDALREGGKAFYRAANTEDWNPILAASAHDDGGLSVQILLAGEPVWMGIWIGDDLRLGAEDAN